MASLYSIQTKLTSLFNQIEENEGEITPEIDKELEITEENFREKIEDYCHAITLYNSEVTCCKEEKTRINNVQKVKTNIVARLKNALLDAVLKFGETGKSGNKIIELPTNKLYTTNRKSVEEDEVRKNKLIQHLFSYLQEVNQNGILELGEKLDVNGLLASINAIAKSYHETPDEFGNTPVEEFIPFTINDLQAVNLHISFDTSLFGLITQHNELCNILLTTSYANIDSSIKTDIVKAICENSPEAITVGQIIQNTSLTIK